MTEIQVIDSTTPVELGVADKVIDGLRARLTGLSADTQPGYQIVKAGISEVRGYRTGVNRSRKALKASALDWGRKVEAEAKRVTDLLLAIEEPLKEEKARIDDEAERLRKETEEQLRLTVLAKELAEKEEREAEVAAQREAERKEREVEATKIQKQREALELDRKRLAEEQLEWQRELDSREGVLAAERAKIEADKQAIQENARKERELKESKAALVKLREEREKFAEAEKVRFAEEQAEQERLAEERKPDREKLEDFGDRLQSVEIPRLKTDWGKGVLEKIADHVQSAVDIAYCGSETQDDQAAQDAADQLLEQSPSS